MTRLSLHVALPLLVSTAMVGGVGCAPMVRDCVNGADCASGQHCVERVCVDRSGADDALVPVPEDDGFDVQQIEGTEVLFGSPPRVVVGIDGNVDIYFLNGDCGELWRARTSLEAAFDVAFLTAPPEGSCFTTLDVVRGADGVDHAVVRRVATDGSTSGAVTIEIDASGVRNMLGFSDDAPNARGLTPRVALDVNGAAHAMWAYGVDGLTVVERVALPATVESSVTDVVSLLNAPSGLALAFDVDGEPATFALDFEAPGDRLVAMYAAEPEGVVLARPELAPGNIDAARCGGNVVNAFRDASFLHLAVLPPDGGPTEKVQIDDDLAATRVNGDLDITCSEGDVWIAHQSGDHLRLYSESIETLEIDDDATTVGLAVVEGTAHVVYATTTGALRYATFTR